MKPQRVNILGYFLEKKNVKKKKTYHVNKVGQGLCQQSFLKK
jgi:hypothetical protein